MTACEDVLWTSTSGAAPVTVSDSSRPPTVRSAFTVAVNPPGRSIPSRLNVLKPASVKVTEYVPGRRSMMLYRPWASVTAVRTFSMRVGLAASTDTPGSTPPDESRTRPAMLLFCANAIAGASTEKTTRTERTRTDERRAARDRKGPSTIMIKPP